MITRFVTSDDGFHYTVARPGIDDLAAMLAEQRRFRLEQLRELEDAELGAPTPLSEVKTALREAARIALAEVEAALARIADGSYGVCVRCGEPILAERLEILPMAAMCMDCQRLAERAPR